MGLSREIVGSGLIVLIVLCCQLATAITYSNHTIQHHAPVELTGAMN